MAFIYKTTNIITGKIYVGKSKINDPRYLGSGKILNASIEKNGVENFTKEIIEECSDELADEREKFWINELKSQLRDVGYNIASGGTGGDTTTYHPNKTKIIEKRKKRLIDWHESMTIEEKIDHGKKISVAKYGKSNGREGLTHADSTIEKMKSADKSYCKSEKWINSHSNAMEKRRGTPAHNRKPVMIDDVRYCSMTEASKSLGFKDKASLYQQIKKGKIKVEYL